MANRPTTLQGEVQIFADQGLALTPDRMHEIAEGMLAMLWAREGKRYAVGVVREGFVPLDPQGWAEAFLTESGHVSVGIYERASDLLAARLRAEGRVV